MIIDLTDKIAIVTGSSTGIGLAVAKGLSRAGAKVIINGRDPESIAFALSAIEEEAPGSRAVGYVGDLGTSTGCAGLIEAHPKCDILVNNLGVYEIQDFFECADSVWDRFFEINVMSGVRLSRAYLPRMTAMGWGRVVFVSSECGLNVPSEQIPYSFSKTAQLSIARGLANRMAGTGVTVNSVLPGPTLSRGVFAMLKNQVPDAEMPFENVVRDFVLAKKPASIIKRASTVEEVASMVIYACSTQASATTGAMLRVDGGVIDTI